MREFFIVYLFYRNYLHFIKHLLKFGKKQEPPNNLLSGCMPSIINKYYQHTGNKTFLQHSCEVSCCVHDTSFLAASETGVHQGVPF